MAIPVFNEKTMRYHDPNTQKMVKTEDAQSQIAAAKGGGGKGKPSSLGAIAAPIVAALRTEFSGLNKHLAFRFEDIKKAILGPSAERREERLAGEDVGPPPPPEEKKGFLDTLQGLNPFKGGMGEKMKIFLLVGALALLLKFGDKLVKPLAATLEWFDREGSILDKLKDTKLWQGIIDIFEKMQTTLKDYKEKWKKELFSREGKLKEKMEEWKTSFTDLQTTVDSIAVNLTSLVESAKGVQQVVSAAFKTVNDYIMSFDKQEAFEDEFGSLHYRKSGTLDASERQELFDDLKKRAGDAISEFFTFTFKSLAGALLGLTLIKSTVGYIMRNAAIMAIFSGVPAAVSAGGPGAAAAAAKLKFARGVGIAGLLIHAISTTWFNVTDSLEKSLEEMGGKFVASNFFANFFGGRDEGGWMNALAQSFKISGTGAGIGMLIGLPFGLPGVLAGGIIGLGVGAVIGAITGWLGKNKMEDIFESIGTKISETADTIAGFFSDVVEGVESAIEGDGFTAGYQKSQAASLERNKRKLISAREDLASAKENTVWGEWFKGQKIQRAQARVDKYTQLVQDAPQQQVNNLQEQINKDLEEIKKMEGYIKSGDTHRLLDPVFVGGVQIAGGHDKTWTQLIKERLENIEATRALQKQWMLDFGIIGLSETALDETIRVAAETKEAAIAALTAGYFPAGQMTLPSYQLINSGNTSADHTQIDSYHSSDLSVEHSDETQEKIQRVIRPGGFSDIRLKEDIKLVGKSPSNIDIYEFKYKGQEGVYQGVMAQEVPWASSVADNGYLYVDYSKVDVEFKKLH